jgi:tetraacyldisaccharide 4'-kinase
MESLRFLLYPFALLYGIAVYFRNMMFDIGILRSKSFPVWVISVGNLSVGGTGKSPHIEYLISILDKLSSSYKNMNITANHTAVLSRGYGRKTSGFLLVDENLTAQEVGDEPKQIKEKYKDVYVAVDEKRARGVKKLLEINKDINLFLLDDAVQHRYVTPTFSILLTNYHKPFYEDHLMPAGNLREQRRGYKRADIIIVTRTPQNLPDVEKKIVIKKINPLTHQKVFFSSVIYDAPVPVYSDSILTPKLDKNTSVVLLTGIANSNDLRKSMLAQAKEVKHINYADHHQYTLVDIMKVVDTFNRIENPDKIIITTEKDAMRLHQSSVVEQLGKLPIFYIPIHIKIREEAEFEEQVLRYLSSSKLYKPIAKIPPQV